MQSTNPSLEDAIGETFPAALALAGVVRVMVTRPPYPCYGVGALRVVAARSEAEGLCLVLSYQSYRRFAREPKVAV